MLGSLALVITASVPALPSDVQGVLMLFLRVFSVPAAARLDSTGSRESVLHVAPGLKNFRVLGDMLHTLRRMHHGKVLQSPWIAFIPTA